VSLEVNSTGTMTGTTFENSFIGAYTAQSHDITFLNDTFRGNKLYGLDPHTYTTRLLIDTVTAEHNGAHGIIFSDGVTDSLVTNSISRNNGENGIMMDKFSGNNVIVNNTVTGNTGDGLVTAASPHNVFSGNTVSDNRVGVRLNDNDAANTTLTNNTVTFNRGYVAESGDQPWELPSGNTEHDNGGELNMAAIWWVAAATGGAIIVSALLLLIWRRNEARGYQKTLEENPEHPHLTVV
jgi:mannuronan 5-epimerase